MEDELSVLDTLLEAGFADQFLGQGGGLGGCFLHNTRYDFNDEVLPLGAALFASLVERSLPLAAHEGRP